MAWGIESGSAFGRGWDAGGLSGKFKTWIVNDYSIHGPKWYLWHDHSADAVNPFIVVSDQAAPTRQSKAKFLKWTTLTATGQQIRLDYYLYWDKTAGSGAGVGLVNTHTNYLGTVDAGTFAYYFRGGNEGLFLITQISTTVYYSLILEWEGIWDGDFDLCEPETASGVTTSSLYKITDPGNYGIDLTALSGWRPNLDASSQLYATITVAGSNKTVNIYKDSDLTQLVAHLPAGNYIGGGATPNYYVVTADNSSGISGSIGFLVTPGAQSLITFRFDRLDMQTGQGGNFTTSHPYFLVDLQSNTPIIVYLTVTNIIGDQLVVNHFGGKNPTAGAILSPFPHRWIYEGSHSQSASPPNPSNQTYMPYCPFPGVEDGGNNNGNYLVGFDWMQGIIGVVNPNPRGRYPGQRPWLHNFGAPSGNVSNRRGWGRIKNLFLTAPGGMSVLQFKRTLNSKDYICYALSGAFANAILDTESLV